MGDREETVLRLTHTFDADREAVFDAWTDPELLRRWWAALEGWDTALADVDLTPGGRYTLSMRNPATGDVYTVVGEYVEVRRPELLVYTWTWDGEPDEMRGSEGTLVRVEFSEDDGRTQVAVTHRGFADSGIRDLHGEGWAGCLANLERRVFGKENQA